MFAPGFEVGSFSRAGEVSPTRFLRTLLTLGGSFYIEELTDRMEKGREGK